MLVAYLKHYGKAKEREIRELLWDKLSDELLDKQKEYKTRNLLAVLKKNSIIDTGSTYQQRSYWVLKQ